MASDIGYNAKIQVNDGSGATYQDFDEVVNITGPAPEAGDVEFTHLQSANRTREYKEGLIEPGDFSFEQHYTSTRLARLYTLQGVSKSFKITFPDSSTATWTGYIKKPEYDITADAPLNIKVTGKVTGSVTFA